MSAYTQIYLHLVWSTKFREPLITPEIEPHLYAYLINKAVQLGCPVMAVGGISDHLHLLLRFSCTITIAKLVADLKGGSSYFVNSELLKNKGFRWQVGYGVFTLRREGIVTVKSYIDRQKEHHQQNHLNQEWEQCSNDSLGFKWPSDRWEPLRPEDIRSPEGGSLL
jgi:putative transposase